MRGKWLPVVRAHEKLLFLEARLERRLVAFRAFFSVVSRRASL